jgi:hypothetical protein
MSIESDIGEKTLSFVDGSLIESESIPLVSQTTLSTQATDVSKQSDGVADAAVVEPAEQDTSQSAVDVPANIDDQHVDSTLTSETNKQVNWQS